MTLEGRLIKRRTL